MGATCKYVKSTGGRNHIIRVSILLNKLRLGHNDLASFYFSENINQNETIEKFTYS